LPWNIWWITIVRWKNFEITDKIYNDFLSYASKQDIKYTQADLDSTSAYIRNTIKSELVRKVKGDSEAYKVTITQDKQLLQALEMFDRFKTLKAMFDYAEAQKTKEK